MCMAATRPRRSVHRCVLDDWLKEITTTQALALCGSGGSLAPFSTMSTALAAGDASTGSHQKDTLSGLSSLNAFPQFPGENVHAHAATQYKEAAEARFAARNLLVVANGGTPAAA